MCRAPQRTCLTRARVSLPNSCVISRNSAGLTGGGWYVTQASTLTLTSSATSGNTAGADGGGGACRHTRVCHTLLASSKTHSLTHIFAICVQAGAQLAP
jgi:hypothetical protein